MQCEFCEAPLADAEPENLAFLAHLSVVPACNERFSYLLENLQASWTKAMSGG